VEQIRIYSRILGVPLDVVSGIAELKESLVKYRAKDAIFIDTTGRNPREEGLPAVFHRLPSGTGDRLKRCDYSDTRSDMVMKSYADRLSEKETIINEFLPFVKYTAQRLSWRLPPSSLGGRPCLRRSDGPSGRPRKAEGGHEGQVFSISPACGGCGFRQMSGFGCHCDDGYAGANLIK
jgi:hypothetical protein